MVIAKRKGSDLSTYPGQPVLTLQYEHALVHVSPRIMKVAVFLSQQSAILGQAASSQTVLRDALENFSLSS